MPDARLVPRTRFVFAANQLSRNEPLTFGKNLGDATHLGAAGITARVLLITSPRSSISFILLRRNSSTTAPSHLQWGDLVGYVITLQPPFNVCGVLCMPRGQGRPCSLATACDLRHYDLNRDYARMPRWPTGLHFAPYFLVFCVDPSYKTFDHVSFSCHISRTSGTSVPTQERSRRMTKTQTH